MAGKGGKRPGAGRPKGKENFRVREEANQAMQQAGIRPIDVLLTTMRDRYAAGDYAGACSLAVHAAPYCHPRLSSITHEDVTPTDYEKFLDAVAAELVARTQTPRLVGDTLSGDADALEGGSGHDLHGGGDDGGPLAGAASPRRPETLPHVLFPPVGEESGGGVNGTGDGTSATG